MPGWLSSMPAGKLVVGGWVKNCHWLKNIKDMQKKPKKMIRNHAWMVRCHASCYKNHQARFNAIFGTSYWVLVQIVPNSNNSRVV